MDTPVTGMPRLLLRVEGVVVLAAAVVAYRALGAPWSLFGLFFLMPDVGLLGYLAGPRIGALAYNTLHTYPGPGAVALFALLGHRPEYWPICGIWMAHIGMDRALGLGLKFPTAFNLTHLGKVGRVASTA
jgi:Domain of unknown function (DUF4260)